MDTFLSDVKHGIRGLLRTPGFTTVALLTLALGIGANTAIFSIVNGVLLRPLAYPRPEQLMYLTTAWVGSRPAAASVMEYLEFQQFNRSFAEVGAFRLGEANFAVGESARRVRSAIVDAHLLNTLGLRSARGRLFVDGETGGIKPAPLAVISYELWQSAFGARPIVGSTADIDGQRLQIVGVMAPGADLMDNHIEVWLPLSFTEDERLSRNNHNHYLIGRLKEGVEAASAQTELNALIQTWAARTGITPGAGHEGHVFLPLGKGSDAHILQMTPLADEVVGPVRRSVWLLQAAVGLVLLIACANVANLLLARAETRRREFAILTALGAGRGRLVLKAITESLILSITGGALGVMFAYAAVEALVRAYPASLPRIAEAAVDMRVMLVSLAVAVGCGLLVGLTSLLHTRQEATAESLKSGSRGSTATTRHHVRRGLVTAEIALAVIVVVGAGLLLRTVQNLTHVDAGFDRSRLVTFSVTLPRASFDLLGRVHTYQRLLEQLRAVPGVDAASAMTGLPFDRPFLVNQTEIANSAAPSASIAPIDYQRVLSGFFETTGVPILQGRGFQSVDAASTGSVAVVNKTLADTYWRGLNPIGQQLRPGGTMPWFTVVGVARDVKQTGVDQPVRPEVYVLVDQIAADPPTSALTITPTTMHVMVRTALPLATLAPAIAGVVRGVDPAVPVARLREMEDVFTESIRRPRLLSQLLTAFSALAVLLAAIGIYGVLAYMVTERRKEIGIRLALGARRATVMAAVMNQGLLLTAIGVVAGIAGALGASRLIESLLFGVRPTDTATLVVVVTAMMVVAAVSCWLPAWRAARVDPATALRAE